MSLRGLGIFVWDLRCNLRRSYGVIQGMELGPATQLVVQLRGLCATPPTFLYMFLYLWLLSPESLTFLCCAEWRWIFIYLHAAGDGNCLEPTA